LNDPENQQGMKNTSANKNNQSVALLKMQFWLFKKQKAHAWLCLLFLLAGFYALYQGFAFKKKQIHTIETFRQDRIGNINKLLAGFDADTTKPAGKVAFDEVSSTRSANWNTVLPACKMPVSSAVFSIGQADVFPYYYSIKIESFFMQIFKQGEIANPLRSLAGHFDVSFWVIFLLPLLIIVFTFNALSSELDNGNWRLLTTQGISASQWLVSRFSLAGLLVLALVSVIFIAGVCLNYFYFQQLPGINDFLFLMGVLLYLCLWFSALYFINTLGSTTSANALFSGIVWTVICIVSPAVFTMLAEKSVPVDNTLISRMSRRPQGSKFENDAFGIRTIAQLGNLHPVYNGAVKDPRHPNFRFSVYTAYHVLLDDTNKAAVAEYHHKIEFRQQMVNASCLLNPAAATDGVLAGLADNDAMANHAFFWQTKAFHAKLQDAFFPKSFYNKPLTKQDYAGFPVFALQNHDRGILLALNFVFLGMMSVGFFVFGNRKLRGLVQ
jgi:ABC-2 type transport system permease protein